MKYLCMVQVRETGEVLAEYVVDISDDIKARHHASIMFRLEHLTEKRDLFIDCVEVGEKD